MISQLLSEECFVHVSAVGVGGTRDHASNMVTRSTGKRRNVGSISASREFRNIDYFDRVNMLELTRSKHVDSIKIIYVPKFSQGWFIL